MLSGFDRWLIELKRRRVFRVGVIYGAVGIAVLQTADVVLDPLGAPPWVLRALVLGAILGLPVALGLAWALDWSGGSLRRDRGADPPDPTTRSVAALELTALVAVLGLGVWLAWSTFGSVRSGETAHSPPAAASIAIIPFVNVDGPETDYLAAGLTEELLTELSRLRSLRVAARGSTADVGSISADPRAIARTLNVATVLSATVRSDAGSIVVAAHLDDAQGFQVWAREYTRPLSDAGAIQDEIAREIADALGLSLLPEERARLNERGTVDAAAYEAYLRGLAGLARRSGASLRSAIDQFRNAVNHDPLFAEAQAGLAQAYYLLPLFDASVPGEAMAERATAAARRALELDPTSAEAFAALGGVAYQVEWRMEEAEGALRRAIALSPSYATAHQWLAETLAVQGRTEPALASIERAIVLDPRSPVRQLIKGFCLYYSGRLESADRAFRAALRLDPNFGFALYYYPDLLVALGRYDEARNIARRAAATYFADDDAAASAWLEGVRLYIDAAEDPLRAQEAREYWAGYRRDRDVFWRFLALARTGDTDGALVSLRLMRDERHPSFVWIPVRIRIEPAIGTDRRVAAVLREAGLEVLDPITTATD